MTDMPPPAEDDDGTVLARFRTAVHELYLASLPDGLRPPVTDPAAAAEALARTRTLGVNRLFCMHAVASNLARRPDLLDLAGAGPLARAIVEEGRVNQGLDVIEAGLRRFAAGLPPARETTELTRTLWRSFLTDINELPYLFEPPEDGDQASAALAGPPTDAPPASPPLPAPPAPPGAVVAPVGIPVFWKPGCNDGEVTDAPAGAACTIRSRFYLNLDPRDAGKFIDPANWVQYGRPFWAQMAVVDGTKKATADGYEAVFEEKVRLPSVGEVTARLRVSYAATDDYVVTRYQVAEAPYANPYVTFDNGWLVASRAFDGATGRSVVEGLKSIRFVDPLLNRYPDLVCDGGWVHFMINMALQGTGLPALSPARLAQLAGSVAPVTDPASVAASVGRVVDTWVAGAKGSLDGHGAHTKAAMTKALADPPDPGWVNDLIAIGGDAPKAAQATMSSLRAAIDELAKLGGTP